MDARAETPYCVFHIGFTLERKIPLSSVQSHYPVFLQTLTKGLCCYTIISSGKWI
ncbi:hypothetical protein CsSME_00000780 [Camellia sinensis var. sinensis]